MKVSIYISIKSIWSNGIIQFHNILVDILFGRSIHCWQCGVKNPIILSVLLSIPFSKYSKIFLIYLGAPMLGAYIFIMFISFWWILPLSVMKCPSGFLFMAFVLKSILSDIRIIIPAFFFSCLFAWIFCFPILPFQSV